MTTLREAAMMALEALDKLWQIIDDIDTYGDMAKADDKLYRSLVERKQRTRFEETGISTDGYTLNGGAITALRTALAQQDEPEEPEEPEAYGYASRLAVAIWEKHYKDTAPQWKPLDYLIGVLTQIDNMTSGLTRQAQQAEPVQEPVAWLYEAGADRTLHWHKPPLYGTPLYTAPPQRQPLTDEEIAEAVREADLDWQAGWTLDEHEPNRFTTLARAIERAHGIGEQP